MRLEDIEGFETFSDPYGNYGYISAEPAPCVVVYYDDDAHHCQAGHGFGWCIYENGYRGDIDHVVVAGRFEADDEAYGFESFEEAFADLEDQELI